MGFPIRVPIGVSLAGYFLGAFNSPNANRSSASLNCPWLQETLPLSSRLLWQTRHPLKLQRQPQHVTAGIGDQ